MDNPFEFLSVRARRTLEILKIKTLDELAQLSRSDVYQTHNCGRVTVKELEDFLSCRGRKFYQRPRLVPSIRVGLIEYPHEVDRVLQRKFSHEILRQKLHADCFQTLTELAKGV